MKHTHFSSPRRALLLLTGLLLVVTASMVVPNRAYLMGKLALLRSTTSNSTVNPQADTSQFTSNPTPSTSFAVPTLFQGPGIAPTGDPGQGFDIEGNLQANTPNANTTDWVPGVAGTGVGVLTAAGVPVDPTKTFRVVDLYNSQSDDLFTGGSKVNDNPNTDWVWATGKPTAKDDVNNGLLHVSMDANNHLWFVVGGDRLSNNGDSHINFEFLQNTLVKNGDGTFTSAGPNGGRTVGDLLLHIDLQQGGNVPDFMVDRWQAVGAGFDWVTITPAAGTAFVAANVAGTTPVSFGAFGSTTYAMNQFAEGAIDITALIANFDPCIGIKTVFIKTATSQSPTAALKDLIEPIQLNLGNRPVAQAGPDQSACAVTGSPSPTSFTVNGTATNGTPAWTVASTTGTITNADVTIVNPTSASTAVNIAAGKTGTVTLTLTVTSNRVPPCTPAATDQVVLTVTQGAVAIAPADVTKCQTIGQPTVFSLTGQVTAGSATPLWSYVSSTGTILAGDVTIATPNNPTTSVSIAAGKIGSVTLRLTSATTACGTATDDVVLTVSAAPTADAGPDLATCQAVSGPTTFNLNGTVTNSSGSTWSYVSSTGTILQADVTIVNPFFPSTAVNIANGKTGTVTLALTAVGTKPSCANAIDEVTLTVKALPSCQITGSTSVCAGSINNTYTGPAGANLSYSWSVTGNGMIVGSTTGQSVNITAGVSGSYTVMLTVVDTVTECSSSCSLPVTVNANPACSITGATAVCASSTNNTYTGPAGANLSYSWSVTGNGTIVGSSTGQSINVTAGAAGLYTVNLTVTNTQTGCSSTCVQQVTVNANPACSITGADAACATSTNNTYTGPAGANLSYSWSVTGNGSIVGSTTGQSVNVTAGAAGSYTLNLTVTNTQTGCSSTCSKVVTVNGLPACSITGPDTVCPSLTGATYSGPTGANLAYSWTIAGTGSISGSTTGQTVNVNAGASGSFILTLTVTNTQTGCSSTCTKSVAITECDDCGPKGPGQVFPSGSEVSDQKAGSVLVYNFYTSIASAPNTQNTRFNITNTSPQSPVAVHLFFIDGTSCSVADSYMCLTANQTASFLASDLDPGTTGYLVAVAVDCQLGCPINFNCLIGDEYIKMASGHVANLGAEAIASLTQNPANCDSNSVTATINFDGIRYNRIPRVLALSGIGSRADGNDTMLVINRIGGNLGIGAASLGSMFGIFYDDAEIALSYTFSGACQFRSSLTNNFPRITPRFETFVPAGRTGWTKFWIAGENGGKGILGASLGFNANAATNANAFSHGHNLHALQLDTTNSYVVPIFPPSCCQ